MTESVAEAERRILSLSLKTYALRNERAALRCGLIDAAGLCDALATVIRHENRMRGGKITKRGQMLAMVATRAADAIMAMREKVEVPR